MHNDESARIRELEKLSDELVSLGDGPNDRETERRIEEIAAQTEKTIAEIDIARDRARRISYDRKRRSTQVRLGMYGFMLVCIIIYFTVFR